MSKREHLRLLLSGDEGIPPAVSCWYHFPPRVHDPHDVVATHLRHLEQYDLDFLQVYL